MNAEEVAEIKRLYESGKKQKEIGAVFGVCQSTISLILSGKSGAKLKYSTRPLVGGPPQGHKVCGKCLQTKSESFFSKSKKKADGLASWCKSCMFDHGRTPEVLERRRKSAQRPERKAARLAYANSDKYKARHLLTRYNVTLVEYKATIAAQGDACAICEVLFSTLQKNQIHTDHDHGTGRFRGVLCHHCNKGLGEFRDMPEFLLSAAIYLLRKP